MRNNGVRPENRIAEKGMVGYHREFLASPRSSSEIFRHSSQRRAGVLEVIIPTFKYTMYTPQTQERE
jgi:hypothetical protein